MRSYRFYCPTCDREGEMIIQCLFSESIEDEPKREWFVCVVCETEVKLLDANAVEKAPHWKQ